MIKISFPDGAIREYEKGVTALEIARSISEGLARKVLDEKLTGRKAIKQLIKNWKPDYLRA